MARTKKVAVDEEQRLEWMDLEDLKPDPKNPKDHDKPTIKASYKRFGFVEVLTMNEQTGLVVAGHGRLESLIEMKLAGEPAPRRIKADGTKWLVPVVRGVSFANETEAHAYLVAANRSSEKGGWLDDPLASLLQEISAASSLDGIGYSASEVAMMLAAARPSTAMPGSLVAAYGEPPFSVLDSRQGRWRESRDYWLGLGIESEVGRDENLLGFSPQTRLKRKTRSAKDKWQGSGTSVFDPVLCELAVRWFSPPDAKVLDPFAGGSVRGVVSGLLGRSYCGYELRQEQVDANRRQWTDIAARLGSTSDVSWVCGDSLKELPNHAEQVDLLFSCPPYMDLEVYSQEPSDLSAMSPKAFEKAYAQIIKAAVGKLKPDRFAVWVISEVRDKKTGFYRGFEQLTIEAFERAGARYYNEAVLINSAGSLPVRIKKQWEGSRKLGRMHQIVLVFCKGDPQKAAAACGPAEGINWGAAQEAESQPVDQELGTDPATQFGTVL